MIVYWMERLLLRNTRYEVQAAGCFHNSWLKETVL